MPSAARERHAQGVTYAGVQRIRDVIGDCGGDTAYSRRCDRDPLGRSANSDVLYPAKADDAE